MNKAVHSAKLSWHFNVSDLSSALDELTHSEWISHVNQKGFEGEWDVVPLRVPSEHVDSHPILQSFSIESAESWSNLPELQANSVLLNVVNSFQCPVRSVRLMRLRASAHIKPHRDYGVCVEQGEARLHVPISGCDHVEFKVAGSTLPMQAGELWYFNADLEHEVRNTGNQDRINLVIDCEVNEWLQDKILTSNPEYEK